MTRPRRVVIVALALAVAPLGYAAASFFGRTAATAPWLEPAKAGTTCLLPRESMRYQHMSYLRRLRDEVVRDGKRAGTAPAHPGGIASCRGCHAHREQFCDRCHERASVQPDCFGCHTY